MDGTSNTTIDELILADDRRGVAALSSFLPTGTCRRGAERLLACEKGSVFIVTGFYEIKPGVIETDGPPGALAVGRALTALGYETRYVSDSFGIPFLEPEVTIEVGVVDFPIASSDESQDFARALLAEVKPVAVIAIERCGATEDGRYLNMWEQDITAYTARTDFLFDRSFTIGIGDLGNEIGMGVVADTIRQTPRLPDNPAVTKTDELVIASVSNWGAYGLIAALSRLSGRDLLPNADNESELIARLVQKGAVDGESLVPMATVDGFSLEENTSVLEKLRRAEI